MALGIRGRKTHAVALEEGAVPGSPRCPACGEPLFVWLKTEGWGPREDQIVDRCENCGLAVSRDTVPDADAAIGELLGDADPRAEEVVFRAANSASLQAWLGAENWAALRPGDGAIKPTPRAIELLLAKAGMEPRRTRYLAAAGMASMWQTLLNLLTFHRDFAAEAASGRLGPGTGRGRAAFSMDVVVTVLAAIPTAGLAVLFEGAAVLARRGGVVEVTASR
ncbi:MAG: hypothetical protein EXQ70_06525 [Solirubrobacterales bacterium]|nr:hypothetical protein [Solirubrobacterales bacterium]